MEILDRGLNAAILAMAARLFPCGYDVSANAPDSWRKLKAHASGNSAHLIIGYDMPASFAPGVRMVVYNGGSERTIYGDDEVNYAFRAWHDWTHIEIDADFSLAGETDTCERQIEHLREFHGDCATVDRWAAILRAEIIGQAHYYARHRRFVANQVGFVRAALVAGLDAALVADWS